MLHLTESVSFHGVHLLQQIVFVLVVEQNVLGDESFLVGHKLVKAQVRRV